MYEIKSISQLCVRIFMTMIHKFWTLNYMELKMVDFCTAGMENKAKEFSLK